MTDHWDDQSRDEREKTRRERDLERELRRRSDREDWGRDRSDRSRPSRDHHRDSRESRRDRDSYRSRRRRSSRSSSPRPRQASSASSGRHSSSRRSHHAAQLPDLSHVPPLDQRVRKNSRWDIPFDGFERVSAALAKRSGHFNLLGEQRPIDDSLLVGLVDPAAGGPTASGGLHFKPNGRPGNMMNRVGAAHASSSQLALPPGAVAGALANGRPGDPLRITASGEPDPSAAAAFVAPLAPDSSRSSRRIIVSNYKSQGYSVTADEVAAYFAESLATINLLAPLAPDTPLIKLARASDSFIMIEFATPELATIAYSFNNSYFKGIDSQWVMLLSRPQDYITPSPSRLELEDAAQAGLKLRAQEIEAEQKRLNADPPATLSDDLQALDRFKAISARVLDSKNKLYVADLPFFLNPGQILDLLAAFGEVSALQILTDKTAPAGETRGVVFLEYKDPDSVNEAALLGLAGMEIGESRLRVGRATYGLHAPWASLPMGIEAMVNLARNIEQETDTKHHKPRRSKASTTSRHKRSSRDYETTDESEGEDEAKIKAEAKREEEEEENDAPLETGRRRPPSRVMLLLNAVTPENLTDDQEYAEIVEDVQKECLKYGPVEEVLVPRPGDNGLAPAAVAQLSFSDAGATGVGKIYVKFARVAACRAACKALGGRKFSDRTIVSTYFPEDNFELRVF